MEATVEAMVMPPGVLDPEVLYSGDNGRIFCGALRCAGQSAHFTGFTISGMEVQRVTEGDVREWLSFDLGRPKCENCGREHVDVPASRLVVPPPPVLWAPRRRKLS